MTLRLSLAPARISASPALTLPLPLALTLRAWRPGDRFQPPHTRSPKKVKELLQSKKLAPELRAQWPVLAHDTEILWLRDFPARTVTITSEDGTTLGTLSVETL